MLEQHLCGQRFWCLRLTAHQLRHGFPVFCRTSQHINSDMASLCSVVPLSTSTPTWLPCVLSYLSAHQLRHGFPVFCRTSQHINSDMASLCSVVPLSTSTPTWLPCVLSYLSARQRSSCAHILQNNRILR